MTCLTALLEMLAPRPSQITDANPIRPSLEICRAPASAYGLVTTLTPAVLPTLASIGSMRARTDGSLMLPLSTRQTIVSASPDAAGNSALSRSSAREESVAGRVNWFAYEDPTPRLMPNRPRKTTSQTSSTSRRWR